VFLRISARVRSAVTPLAGTEAGRRQLEMGAGGDRTMEVDRAAEEAVFTELEAVARQGETFSVLSEEAGLRRFGADRPLVIVDPVDGSLNAKQGIPFFNVMLALLSGPTIGEVTAGSVVNLVDGQSWTAVRGGGAEHDGRPIQPLAPARRGAIELLGLESSPRSLKAAWPLVERSSKVRILGSMALSVAHTAAGGIDVFCAPLPMRVFDMAASLLILTESGGVASDVKGHPLDALACNLATRTTLLCSADHGLHALALSSLAGPG
jgi:myo-inositol-1(or 4)-monophosphatase